jgi:KaiC/GvpD/RAD55 family RecA-like ATPase
MLYMAMKRVSTGIDGLDGLIEGGFVQGSVNMVTGSTGTGKTIFGTQFMWCGLQKGETCVYITMEEDPIDIKEDVASFGWDFAKYEKRGLCRVIYHDPAQVNNLSSVMTEEISKLKANRLVIDSTSIMGLNIEKPSQVRRRLFGVVSALKNHDGCTALVLTEVPEDSKALSRWGVEEFVVDGVIVLNYLGIGEEFNRSMMIRKMRRTNHGKDIYPFEITSQGIILKAPDV